MLDEAIGYKTCGRCTQLLPYDRFYAAPAES